jgi:Carboxypeptidase regulatory-like domain
MRYVNSIVGVALIVMVFSVTNAFGCTCGGGGAPCEDYGRAAAVFVGTPISVRTGERSPMSNGNEIGYGPRIFTFSVEQAFLGRTAEIEVSTPMNTCAYDFKIGTRYLVYAFDASVASVPAITGAYSKNRRLTTSTCSRTRPFTDASEDLEFFRSFGSRGAGVTIQGEVKRARQNVATGNPSEWRPLANIGLTIEREGERRDILTDAEGRFRLAGLSPGKFKVTLLLPDELYTYKPEQEITVSDRGCATVDYHVVDNGRLSGRLLDPEGQPAVKVELQLMEADHTDPMKDQAKYAQTDAEGRFTFDSLPPGRYVLAANLKRFPKQNDPGNVYPRTFYPGVLDMSKTEFIDIGAGEAVRGRDWQLPVRQVPSTLTGKVVLADGTPVAKAMILFRDVTYDDAPMKNEMEQFMQLLGNPQMVEADDSGYFTIKGYVGQIYVMACMNKRPSVDGRRSEPERLDRVRIVLARPNESVNIVLR